jgi:hypothetical protein
MDTSCYECGVRDEQKSAGRVVWHRRYSPVAVTVQAATVLVVFVARVVEVSSLSRGSADVGVQERAEKPMRGSRFGFLRHSSTEDAYTCAYAFGGCWAQTAPVRRASVAEASTRAAPCRSRRRKRKITNRSEGKETDRYTEKPSVKPLDLRKAGVGIFAASGKMGGGKECRGRTPCIAGPDRNFDPRTCVVTSAQPRLCLRAMIGQHQRIVFPFRSTTKKTATALVYIMAKNGCHFRPIHSYNSR